MVLKRIGDWLSSRPIARNEEGTATIEAVLWLPVFLTLFGLVADVSTIMGREAQILRIVETANRALAVGAFQTTLDAKAYISNEVKAFSGNAAVAVIIDKGIISSNVSLPAADLTITGLLHVFSSLQLSVEASQMLEV